MIQAAITKLLDRKELSPGEEAFARVTSRSKIPLFAGQRFVLRDRSTIGASGRR